MAAFDNCYLVKMLRYKVFPLRSIFFDKHRTVDPISGVYSNYRKEQTLSSPVGLSFNLGQVEIKTLDKTQNPSDGSGIVFQNIQQGWSYLLDQRFHTCFVLKFALQRGEGENKE